MTYLYELTQNNISLELAYTVLYWIEGYENVTFKPVEINNN